MSGARRGLKLLAVLVAMMAGLVNTAMAQIVTTTVQDTVYSANGTPASGTVLVSWNAFTTAGGQSVPSGTTSVTIGAGGVLTIALAPNAGSTPMGSYYTAVFHLSDGATSREYWVVPVTIPGGGPATLAAIKNQVLPISVAMQTVSKVYVDDAIAAAATGSPLDSSPYVLTAGDTMTGPLLLPADPVSPNQAADKNYVDNNIAATAAGLGQKVSLLPTATQAVAQPNGTNFGIDSAYASTTFTSTGTSSQSTITSASTSANPAVDSYIEHSSGLNCFQPGYDLGNNGTSADGWSNCTLDYDLEESATRGIDQLHSGVFSHFAQGDTAAFYTYLTSFGGKVASSDEGVEHTVIQSHQVGYYTGVLSNMTYGNSNDNGSGLGEGTSYFRTTANTSITSPIASFTVAFGFTTTSTPITMLIGTISGTTVTINSTFTVTAAAETGGHTQTFVAGVDYSSESIGAGQTLGVFMPSGGGNAFPVSFGTGGGLALTGTPVVGTPATYTSNNAVSIAFTIASGASTGSNLLITSDFSCHGYCQAMDGNEFADGGILLDTSRGGSTATLSGAGQLLNGSYYTLGTGSVTESTAWGNIIPNSCTNNGNGEYQVYVSTTCNVTLGSSPASPGNFVAGQDIFLTGPFEEEAAVTAVGTPAGGVQSISFNTRYAWNNGNAALVMQGGPGSQSIVATNAANSWPVAYAVVGAFSPTQVVYSNCVVGVCNTGQGNILLPASTSFSGGSTVGRLTRTGDVVSVTFGGEGPLTTFPAGSTIVVSGFTPSDLNGTFTVASNSMNEQSPAMTWDQTGANEASSVSGSIAQPPTSITFYPSAFIIGTDNGINGAAQLATNTVPFAAGDTVTGAPTSEFGNVGLRMAIGQYTPVDGSQPSSGISVGDDGPSPLDYAYGATNTPSNGVAGVMFSVSGSYSNDFDFGYRPANGGAILYVQGNNPVASTSATTPYNIFHDNAGGGEIGYNPASNVFSFTTPSGGGTVGTGNVTATSSASMFATGTTFGGVLPCLQNGTDCPAGTSGGGGTGSVTSVAVGTWPSWLTPTVTNATTTPTLTVAVSAIPNAALTNSSTAINGQTCTLGSTCTITASPPADVKFYQAAVCDSGTAYASGVTRYDNQQPQAGCVLPASSALAYLAFNAAPSLPQYAEATVSTPPFWTGTSLYINFYSAAVTGTVTWEVQTACIGVGSVVGSPIFGTAVPVTTTVSSTAGGDVVTAILSSIATPGANSCPSTSTNPGLLTYRIYRSATDTAGGNANLLGATLVTGRSQ
jgi:hypothetical protein